MLSDDLATAISEADWARVVELLVQRREQLEAAFAQQPQDEQELALLRNLAERILTEDQQLLAVASEARRRTAAELKAITTGRQATEAYRSSGG